MTRIDLHKVEELFSSTGRKIYDTAEATVKRFNMEGKIGSGVCIGFSGGADSVMLLCFLLEYRRRHSLDFGIVCAHVNHQIRGNEADADEAFSRSFCESLGVEEISSRFDIPAMAAHYRLGIEEMARDMRYRTFDKIILGRDDISAIAVAHNMTDNAETVVFNLLRGSGARGASGIPPVRENIIRPLIGVSKKDILLALDEAGIPYVTDSTNSSDDYTRNYIRHNILTAFEEVSSDPEKMLSRFSDNMRADEDFIISSAMDFLAGRNTVRNSDLLALHPALLARVVAIMAKKVGGSVSYSIIKDIRSLLSKDNFCYSIIGGAAFVCERGMCRISRNIGNKQDYCFEVCEGINDLSPLNAHLVLSYSKLDKSYLNVYKNSIQANLSSAIINGSLYIRPKQDGDTVYYGGMTHKLKKLFSDRKIPPSKRGLIPILCDDSGVLWVPGFGVRDDGVSAEERKDTYVLLGITADTESDEERLYSGSEFRS